MADNKVPNIPQKQVIAAVSTARTSAEPDAPPSDKPSVIAAVSAPQSNAEPKAQTTPIQRPQSLSETEICAKRTAKELYAHLVATGTPREVLSAISGWLNDNPNAMAISYYDNCLIKCSKVTWGTLNKAIKFAKGDGHTPENSDPQAPLEELQRLRKENENTKAELAQKSAYCLSLIRERDEAVNKCNDARRESYILKNQRTREELEAMGIGSDSNELVGAR